MMLSSQKLFGMFKYLFLLFICVDNISLPTFNNSIYQLCAQVVIHQTGATNRPQELDEAARRRLTKRLYIPLPSSGAHISVDYICLEIFINI